MRENMYCAKISSFTVFVGRTPAPSGNLKPACMIESTLPLPGPGGMALFRHLLLYTIWLSASLEDPDQILALARKMILFCLQYNGKVVTVLTHRVLRTVCNHSLTKKSLRFFNKIIDIHVPLNTLYFSS